MSNFIHYGEPGGRPRFAPLLTFKVLVLQSLHGLADDALCFQITDRNSFRAFLGLTPADAVPDGQPKRSEIDHRRWPEG